nr:hypothetical protein [Stigmatella aurantiaca]
MDEGTKEAEREEALVQVPGQTEGQRLKEMLRAALPEEAPERTLTERETAAP